ncbi:hypothetical protein T484DRAFT_1772989, partial [Baffinella frigidus]
MALGMQAGMWRAGSWLRWLVMAALVWGGVALPRSWVGANQMIPWRPGGRMGGAMAALDGRLYMFGGATAIKAPSTWLSGLDTLFSRQGGKMADTALLGEMLFFDADRARWIKVPAVGSEQPEARADHGLASLPATGKLVLVGGVSRTAEVLGDVWTFDPGFARWRREATSPVGRRTLHAFCSGDTAVYLYGGVADFTLSATNINQDLWMVSPDLTWTQLSDGQGNNRPVDHPGYRLGAGMASEGRRVFLFGGCTGNEMEDCLLSPQDFLSDVWAFGLDSRAWERLSGAWSDSESTPSPRWFQGFAALP